MDRITPNQYIRLNKKICDARMILTIHKLSNEWIITPEKVCYRLLEEAIAKEHHKSQTDKK